MTKHPERPRRGRPSPPFKIDIRALREELGLTQPEFASRLDVDLRTVIRWESNDGRPHESARKKLLDLYQRIQIGAAPKHELRVGICCEFLDTSYPLLTQKPTNFVARSRLPPITFVPIPWEDRCLEGLNTNHLDVVIYNEYCAKNYPTPSPFVFSNPYRGIYPSGEFYIAFRLREVDERRFLAPLRSSDARPVKRRTEEALPNGTRVVGIDERKESESALAWLLKTFCCGLATDQLTAIVPPADMRQSVRLILERCVSNAGWLQGTPDVSTLLSKRLSLTPGEGLNFFLHYWPTTWRTAGSVAYVGGQDQLATIRKTQRERKSAVISVGNETEFREAAKRLVQQYKEDDERKRKRDVPVAGVSRQADLREKVDYGTTIWLLRGRDFTGPDLKNLQIQLPAELSRNVLVARDGSLGSASLEELVRVLAQVIERLKRKPKDEEYWKDAKKEIARWHQIHNTRFRDADPVEVLSSVIELAEEFDETETIIQEAQESAQTSRG